jgi:hypothetical protein
MNNHINKINSTNWRDWALEKIIFDDNTEDLKIILSNEYEKNVIFRCKNYIGISYLGHWDEGIIENMWTENNGDILSESKKIIISNRPDGFAFKNDEIRFANEWFQLNIKLIDGVIIKIAFKEIEFEEVIV